MAPAEQAPRSLLELAATLNAERAARETRCPVARLLRDMPADAAAELDTLLRMEKRAMPNTVIREALTSAGYAIELSPIESHRRNLHGGMGCKCPSPTTR